MNTFVMPLPTVSEAVKNYLSVNADGITDSHSIPCNETYIYDKDGSVWPLLSGDKLTFDILIHDRGFPYGQGAEIGYLLNGLENPIIFRQIQSKIHLEFTAPQSGDYLFYIRCASSDPLLVKKIIVK